MRLSASLLLDPFSDEVDQLAELFGEVDEEGGDAESNPKCCPYVAFHVVSAHLVRDGASRVVIFKHT